MILYLKPQAPKLELHREKWGNNKNKKMNCRTKDCAQLLVGCSLFTRRLFCKHDMQLFLKLVRYLKEKKKADSFSNLWTSYIYIGGVTLSDPKSVYHCTPYPEGGDGGEEPGERPDRDRRSKSFP